MSKESNRLRCNHCWEHINEPTAYITSCYHIFCVKDARNWFRTRQECPACKQSLTQASLAEVPLSLIDKNGSSNWHMLWGLDIHDIDQVALAARKMWAYQKKQEVAWLIHENREKQREIDHLKQKIQRVQDQADAHITALTQERATLANTLSQRTRDLESKVNECEEWQRRAQQYEKMCSKLRHSSSSAVGSPAPVPVHIRPPPSNHQSPIDDPSLVFTSPPTYASPRHFSQSVVIPRGRTGDNHSRGGGGGGGVIRTPLAPLPTRSPAGRSPGVHRMSMTPKTKNVTPVARVFQTSLRRSPAIFRPQLWKR